MKLLGHNWETDKDLIYPAFAEIYFAKKVQGSKVKLHGEIKCYDNIKQVMDTIAITKRSIAGKLAKLYNPTGLFEPLKLQL